VVGPPRSVFLGRGGSRSGRWGSRRQCVSGALLLWAVPLLLPAVPDLVEWLRLGTQLLLRRGLRDKALRSEPRSLSIRAGRGAADCRQKVHTFVAEQGAATRLALSFEKTVR
jgi:hypothetical protein